MNEMPNSSSNILKYSIITGLLCFSSIMSNAQITGGANQQSMNENSPYNRYGVGLMEDIASAVIRSMGGGGNAFSDEISSNTHNPASYSYMLGTTLDGGFAAKQRSVTFQGGLPVKSFTGSLSYVNLVVPIKKIGGLAFGFRPLSNSYYKSADTGSIGSDKIITTFNGNGGLNNAYLGLSGKIYDFSIGVNVGYTFGSLNHHNYLSSYGLSSIRSYRYTDYTRYGGWNWKVGLMHKLKFSNENYLNIGLTYAASQSLKGKKNKLGVTANEVLSTNGALQAVNMDTVIIGNSEAGTLVLPASYGIGLYYAGGTKFELIGDFEYKDWSKFRNYNEVDSVAKSTYRASIGASYTPNANSLYTTSTKGNYFSAITYRIGAYYGQDYLNLRGTQFNDMGATFGFSFPLKRISGTNQIGKIHSSFAVGQRGTYTNGLAKENYFKMTIAVSLNDLWFVKPKYD